jgi:integrase
LYHYSLRKSSLGHFYAQNQKGMVQMPRETFTFEGKRYDVTAKTEGELAVKIDRKKRELEEGTVILNKSTTVKKWTEEWLTTYVEPNVSDATLYAYKSRIKIYITSAIGSMRLIDVKPIHLTKILNSASGCSKDHIKKIRYTLVQIFTKALRNKLIAINPAEDLKLPKAENNTRRSITDTERSYILKVAETHPSGLWVKLMLYCGLRPQETAALQGRHLDLKGGNLKIENALKRHDNTIGTTKSKSGERTVPIPDILLPELKNLKVEPYDYVFKNQGGSHMTTAGMRTRWRSFERSMNIEMGCKTFKNAVVPPYRVADDLVPYCLRHTYCTDLQDAGVPINVAKELMGHSDISITAKIYTHHSETSYNNAKNLINNMHNGTKTPTLSPTSDVEK